MAWFEKFKIQDSHATFLVSHAPNFSDHTLGRTSPVVHRFNLFIRDDISPVYARILLQSSSTTETPFVPYVYRYAISVIPIGPSTHRRYPPE